jgi:hypothetical protein
MEREAYTQTGKASSATIYGAVPTTLLEDKDSGGGSHERNRLRI